MASKSFPKSGLRRAALALTAVALGPTAALAGDAAPPTLALSQLPDRQALAELVWARSSAVVDVRTRLGLAQADVVRSGLLPNPALDVAVGGLPVGDTNPVGLPVGQVVNAGATLSEQVELFKRGPRQRAAAASAQQARHEAREALRQAVLDLAGAVADVASSEVHLAALADSAAGAARLTAIQEARSGRGDSAGLDTERARLEEAKVELALGEERGHLEEALRACSALAGVRCEPFGSPALAQQYLESRDPATSQPSPENRDVVRALDAQGLAAREQAALAEAHAVPDPTFRVGYLKDQFVVSGNNPSTLLVGVSVPLPVFDRGQADAQAARVQAEASARQRALVLERGERDRARLEAQLDLAKKRERLLETKTLPLARQVVENLEKALLVGSPIQDLILARRTLSELQAQAADVDNTVYHLMLELDRALGRTPRLPAELEDAS